MSPHVLYQYNQCLLFRHLVCWASLLCELSPENITRLATRYGNMPSLVKIEEFNPTSTNINQYLERLERYFVANGVTADSAESHKRRATHICDRFLALWYSSDAFSTKIYAQLAIICKNHFAPKTLVIAERYRFHNCSQREGESVASFAANLTHFASTCNFGTHLNEALRDRFVCGFRSKDIQKKLLTEEHAFDEGLKNALGAKAAEKDVAFFFQTAATLVNKLDSGYRRTFRPNKPLNPTGKGQGDKLASQRNNTSTIPIPIPGQLKESQPNLRWRPRPNQSSTRHDQFVMLSKKQLKPYTTVFNLGVLWRGPVEFSEWVTNGWHYTEYAVTVNPQLNVPQYPIPLPEDVFVKLRGSNDSPSLIWRALSATSIGPWKPAIHHHQHPSGSLPLQKATFRYCPIPCNLSAYHGHHPSRPGTCRNHSRWYLNHG